MTWCDILTQKLWVFDFFFLLLLVLNLKRVLDCFLAMGRHKWVSRKKPSLIKFNSFPAKGPGLYSLKIPGNQRFSGVFRGYKTGTLARNGINKALKDIIWKN